MDALNKKNNYIETEEIFNYSIFKINNSRLLFLNKYKLYVIVCIMRDDQKLFTIEKKRY